MPRGRAARATRSSRLPEIFEMDGHLLESYNHIDDLPRLSDEPKKRPRHVTRGSVAAERRAAAAAERIHIPAPTPSPRPTRRNRAAAAAAATATATADAAAAAAAVPKRPQQRSNAQHPAVCCRVCLRSNSVANIIRCSLCRKGVHTFCLNPPLVHLPTLASWKCHKCTRAPLSLKTETRAILRDALVKYPSLCTNSFLHNIIHVAASLDAAALTRNLTSPLTANPPPTTPATSATPATPATPASPASPAAPHSPAVSAHPCNPVPPDRAMHPVIPLPRPHAVSPHHPPASTPSLTRNNAVILRVPTRLFLDHVPLFEPAPSKRKLRSSVARSTATPPEAARPPAAPTAPTHPLPPPPKPHARPKHARSPLHRSKLPLQKRYKYDVARSAPEPSPAQPLPLPPPPPPPPPPHAAAVTAATAAAAAAAAAALAAHDAASHVPTPPPPPSLPHARDAQQERAHARSARPAARAAPNAREASHFAAPPPAANGAAVAARAARHGSTLSRFSASVPRSAAACTPAAAHAPHAVPLGAKRPRQHRLAAHLQPSSAFGARVEAQHAVRRAAPNLDPANNIARVTDPSSPLRTAFNKVSQRAAPNFPTRGSAAAWKEHTPSSNALNPVPQVPAAKADPVLSAASSSVRNTNPGCRTVEPSPEKVPAKPSLSAVQPGPTRTVASRQPDSSVNFSATGAKPIGASGPQLSSLPQNFAGITTPTAPKGHRQASQRMSAQNVAQSSSANRVAAFRDGRSSSRIKTVQAAPVVSFERKIRRDATSRMATDGASGLGSAGLRNQPLASKARTETGDSSNKIIAQVKTTRNDHAGNIPSPARGATAVGSTTARKDSALMQKATNQTAKCNAPLNNSANQADGTLPNVTDLQWEAKREALMAFAQVQRKLAFSQEQQKLRAGSAAGAGAKALRDGSQMERLVSRNQNVPETERHRMASTALAISSMHRYSNHKQPKVQAAKRGSINSLLQPNAEFPPPGRAAPSGRMQVNRSDPSTFNQFAGQTNCGSRNKFDALHASGNTHNIDQHRGGPQGQRVSTSRQPVYGSGQDQTYRASNAAFVGSSGRIPPSNMTLGQEKANFLAPNLQDSRRNHQVYERHSETGKRQQGQSRIDCSLPAAKQKSALAYGVHSQNTQGVVLPVDQASNASHGRPGPRLPSASSLHLPRPEDYVPNTYQAFSNVPSHARLAPVSFPSKTDKAGCPQVGARVLEPMEMPPYGRPGDPIRYNDPPPPQFRRVTAAAPVVRDRTAVTPKPTQNMEHIYMNSNMSSTKSVHRNLDEGQVGPIRESLTQNDYVSTLTPRNEALPNDCVDRFMNMATPEERATMGNGPATEKSAQRFAAPYVKAETRRVPFEQKEGVAFLRTRHDGRRLSTGMMTDVGLGGGAAMLNRTAAVHLAQTANASTSVGESGSAFRVHGLKEQLPRLDYADGFHVQRLRSEGGGSVGGGDRLGAAMDNGVRLGVLPDAGMSLSKQIRALVASNSKSGGATARGCNQADGGHLGDAVGDGTHALQTDGARHESNLARQIPAAVTGGESGLGASGAYAEESRAAGATAENGAATGK